MLRHVLTSGGTGKDFTCRVTGQTENNVDDAQMWAEAGTLAVTQANRDVQ